MTSYEPVIGLEVHVQLSTRTKLFCADSAAFGAPPNANLCPVCLGLPGALPVTNGHAVQLGVRAALALRCTVHPTSIFARKNYFYPDLPKGYQITQFDRPLATDGWIEIPGGEAAGRARAGVPGGARPGGTAPAAGGAAEDRRVRVRIRRLHLEEDAGKSLHDRVPGATAIDLNRAGVPLIEIVSEPDLDSPSNARAYLLRLKQILEYLEVSDCDMEKGSLRVDANVSVRPEGQDMLGTKTEVKNMNSFANVERALAFEVERQVAVLEAGDAVIHETLLWDERKGEARPMRSKEESHDYRYFPEPDLPPLAIEPDRIAALGADLPELPDARGQRFRDAYALPVYDADVLTATRPVADYFEAVAAAADDAKAASNWVMTDVLGWLKERQCEIADFPIPAEHLGELIRLVGDGTLSSSLARKVFTRMAETGRPPAGIVEEEGLAQISDVGSIEAWVDEVIAAHPNEAARYQAGDAKVFGFLMGQVMKRSKGKADPRRANQALRERLA